MVNLTYDIIPTKEMFDYYEKRTERHIKLVQKNMKIFSNKYPDLSGQIDKISKYHDISKYGENEFIPYVWLTWIKKPGNDDFQYNKEKIDKLIKKAWQSHIKNNPHHPEHHKDENDMDFFHIVEMVCDWEAMSEEIGGTTLEWYKKNVPSRWKFDKINQIIIENIITLLENSNGYIK